METVQPHGETQETSKPQRQTTPQVSEECLVIRNYDGDESYTVTVQYWDVKGESVYTREVTVGPLETITFESRLQRRAYRVVASLDSGERAETTCLIGSGLSETALVETGNRTVSVTDGLQ
ncbi:hypothetical protein ACFQJ7_08140 [Halovenus rubra]|uniref:Uncharacterized protein n=2 Tax=Halovenus rubra TaxID=869890 RepID=A0ACC7E423_9EURY|nr:hypothetical protein [Halovenus rubra]